MKCPDCGHVPMDIIKPTVTYEDVLLGRYRMHACPNCNLRLLSPQAAKAMRKKVEAEMRARRLRSMPKILGQVAPDQ